MKRITKKKGILAAIVIVAVAVAAFFAATEIFIPMRGYSQAEALLNAGQYGEAAQAFAVLGDYRDAAARVDECACLGAEELMAAGEYGQAYELLFAFREYEGAAVLLESSAQLKEAAFTVGNIVQFGRYPQNKEGTDNSPIEWIVLERDGSRALLLSRYGLDCQPYNGTSSSITWENCSLRAWLNGEFFGSVFTETEQQGILLTEVDNSPEQGHWDTVSGNNTQDRVFLLSCAEAEEYFGAARWNKECVAARIAPTPRKAEDAYRVADMLTEGGDAAGWWWLRSPGEFENCAAVILSSGSLGFESVRSGYVCIRPAIWVDLDSGVF